MSDVHKIVVSMLMSCILLLHAAEEQYQKDLGEQLRQAAGEGKIDDVQRLLQQGVYVDAVEDPWEMGFILKEVNGRLIYMQNFENKKVSRKKTPLMIAAGTGHNEVVALLLQLGADINACDFYSRTPLIHAAMGSLNASIDQLIDAGADVNLQTFNGNTALIFAVYCSYSVDYVARKLVIGQEYEDYSTEDKKHFWDMFHINESNIMNIKSVHDIREIAYQRRKERVLSLLKAGANINTKNENNDTVLTCAVIGGMTDIVELLLMAGADTQGIKEVAQEYCPKMLTTLKPFVAIKDNLSKDVFKKECSVIDAYAQFQKGEHDGLRQMLCQCQAEPATAAFFELCQRNYEKTLSQKLLEQDKKDSDSFQRKVLPDIVEGVMYPMHLHSVQQKLQNVCKPDHVASLVTWIMHNYQGGIEQKISSKSLEQVAQNAENFVSEVEQGNQQGKKQVKEDSDCCGCVIS